MKATLWTNNRSLAKAVRDAVAPNELSVKACTVKSHPSRADAVVSKAALSAATVLLECAYQCREGTFVLPESEDALLDAVASGRVLTMIGNDVANEKRIVAASLDEAA